MAFRDAIDRVPDEEDWDRLCRVVDKMRHILNDILASGVIARGPDGVFTVNLSGDARLMLATRVFGQKVSLEVVDSVSGGSSGSSVDDVKLALWPRVFGPKVSYGAVG